MSRSNNKNISSGTWPTCTTGPQQQGIGSQPLAQKLKPFVYGSCLRLAFIKRSFSLSISNVGCYSDSIYLWNPCIKKLVNLPKPSSDFATSASDRAKRSVCIGLGYNNKINDYKLLKITQFVRRSIHTVLELYSIRSNTWKRVDINSTFASRFLISGSNCDGLCFASGSLHFTAGSPLASWRSLRRVILGFDVCNEVLHEIMLPESLQYWFLCLKVVGFDGGSSIAVVYSFPGPWGMEKNVWAMRKYGVVESWTNLFSTASNSLHKILELGKDGKVFVEGFTSSYGFGKDLISCDPEGQQFNVSSVVRCENSLVSSYTGSSPALLDRRTIVIDTICGSIDINGADPPSEGRRGKTNKYVLQKQMS